MVTIRAQHITHTINISGAIIQMNDSQNMALPSQSLEVRSFNSVMEIEELGERMGERGAAPYDFTGGGPALELIRVKSDVDSPGAGKEMEDQETVWP
jgi:hypothetical protein